MALIDDIYEAAVLPELWPDVLERINDRISGAGCTLITIDAAPPRWTASHSIRERAKLYFESGWSERNDRISKLLADGSTGFVRDIDFFSREEIAALPMIREFFIPQGFGWSAAMATPMPTGEVLLFSIEQAWKNGPISDASIAVLETLRPHLSRSALLTTKLGFERAKATVDAFGLASLPAALLRANGTVVAANALFVGIGPQIAIGAFDRLEVYAPDAAMLVEAALRNVPAQDGARAPLSIAIPATAEAPPLVLHILPAEGQARDLFGAATALMIVTRVTAGNNGPPAHLLRALFDLTPAEARLAEALLIGMASAEIAASMKISNETLRSHVKSVLRKTGFHRRLDLVRFLAGIPSFGDEG